jgi:Zn-dependent M16 (insulinase) family peptidase
MRTCLLLFTANLLYSLLITSENYAQTSVQTNSGVNASGTSKSNTAFFSKLRKGTITNEFKASAVYLDDTDQPIGGRFIHLASGYTLDLLQIESVPQALIWVNSFPVSDKGEPHTQEHLLISKGNKGRNVATTTDMSLGRFNAYTTQLHTVYNFYTAAGSEVFFSLFGQFMDALIHPDYNSNEVSREVRNWGVTENADKRHRLEEKGSVYNEMSNAMTNGWFLLFENISDLLYGKDHPLSYSAGGLPSAIREINAADIAAFHKKNYFPANMGAIVTLPSSVSPELALKEFDLLLKGFIIPGKPVIPVNEKLPVAIPDPVRKSALSLVPAASLEEPSQMLLAYPALLELNATEFLLLNNFLQTFAGDAPSDLYNVFVNSKTRQQSVQAQSVFGYLSINKTYQVYFGLDAMPPSMATLAAGDSARNMIMKEITKLAAYKDGSAALKAFNERFLNALTSDLRQKSKLVNSPPQFGFRSTGDTWREHLLLLNNDTGFRKSLVLKPEIESVRKLIASGRNIWASYLAKWQLLNTEPYLAINKSDTVALKELEESRQQRSALEVAALKSKYKMEDDQLAIARYKVEYDSTTSEMDKQEAMTSIRFLDKPPLTLDDQLKYTSKRLKPFVPLVTSSFNSMSGGTVGIAFDLHAMAEDKLVYMAAFPNLLTKSGIIRMGKAIPYEQMSQAMLREILSLNASYSTNHIRNRYELVIRASGNDKTESIKAVGWMNDVLLHPYWSKENIPRMRDVVDQELAGVRQRMRSAEETWVHDPAAALIAQHHPLQLATSSFLTASHNLLRLKWMLRHLESANDNAALDKYFVLLARADPSRTSLLQIMSSITSGGEPAETPGSLPDNQLMTHFNNLRGEAAAAVKELMADLRLAITEIPDETLKEDWRYLCNRLRKDAAQPIEKTLADLQAIKSSILNVHNLRTFVISSGIHQETIERSLQSMLNGFARSAPKKKPYLTDQIIYSRVMSRTGSKKTPVFTGLVNPNSQTGVFLHTVPLSDFKDTSKISLLRILASELYAGSSKQSVFSRTIGAGLAYSNGIRVDPHHGRFGYYAERTPELPQTLRFVINEVKKAPLDSSIIDYTLSLALAENRAASEFENRGEAMATDIAEGITPTVVTRFRKAMLKLRKDEQLLTQIYAHKDEQYEQLLPGYGKKASGIKGATYLVIGPEKQMKAYEAYLNSTNQEEQLFRIYPRDFWMVVEK